MVKSKEAIGMTAEALRETLNERSLDLTMNEAGDLLIRQIETREHWVIVFDSFGAKAIKEMLDRHYPLEKAGLGDCLGIVAPCSDGENFFGAISLCKRLMLAPQLRWILTKFGVPMAEHEILEPNVLIIAARDRIRDISDFGEMLFGDKFRAATVTCASKGLFT